MSVMQTMLHLTGFGFTLLFIVLDAVGPGRRGRVVLAVGLVALAVLLSWLPGGTAVARAVFTENGVVEWGTVAILLFGAVVCFRSAIVEMRRRRRIPWGTAMMAAALAVLVMEELDWGQRVVAFQSAEYFAAHNRHGQMNIHGLWGYLPEVVAIDLVFLWVNLAPRILGGRGRSVLTSFLMAPVERIFFNTGLLFDLINTWICAPGTRVHPLEETGELLIAVGLVLFTCRYARHRTAAPTA